MQSGVKSKNQANGEIGSIKGARGQVCEKLRKELSNNYYENQYTHY